MPQGGAKKGMSDLTTRAILSQWWPLAASWLLMSLEVPAVTAVMARLADPDIHLAAYGGIVFPVALLIESPVMMLLAASTALSKDWSSYVTLRRYMNFGGLALTFCHVMLAVTPLYDLTVRHVIHAPPEIIAPARLGLIIMIPWTWSIAYRRFNQGVLIRYGHPRAVTVGSLVRLVAAAGVLTVGYWNGTAPGIAVAATAVVCGVVAEAIYIGIRVRPVLVDQVQIAPPTAHPLHLRGFLKFYIPLVLTSLLSLTVQPLGSAALSRMPEALESLAVWPVVFGFMFLFRSLGLAYQEVVVYALEKPGAVQALRRFACALTFWIVAILLLIASTPLSNFWFEQVSGLKESLSSMALSSLWLGIVWPGLGVMQHLYQGILVHQHKTRGITESVLVFLILCAVLLGAGVFLNRMAGIYVGLAAFSIGGLGQGAWVWWRSRGPILQLQQAGKR